RVEDLRAKGAVGDGAHEPRHDPPASEGLEVRPHGLLAPGSAEDVGGRARLHRLLRGTLQALPRDRELRLLAREHSARKDLPVVGAVVLRRGTLLAHGGRPYQWAGGSRYETFKAAVGSRAMQSRAM